MGTAGRSATGRLTAEATLLVASHDRRTPFISWEGNGLALLARGVFHVRGHRVRARPFIAGGAGVMCSHGVVVERESHVVPGTVGPIVGRRQWDWTAFAWEGAAGVDIAAGSRAFVRTEVGPTGGEFSRASQLGVPEPPLWTTRVTAGVGLKF